VRYIGKVIDNNSTNGPEGVENGSVSVYIEEIMLDIPKDLYPWVFSDGEFTSNIPEIGDYVWVEFLDENNFRNGFYGDKVSLKEYHEHNETIGSITSSYPAVKYLRLANGVAIGFSSDPDSPEISIYHSEGKEIYVNNDNMTISAFDSQIIINDTGIQVSASGKTIQVSGTPGAPNGLGGFCGLAGGACLFTGAVITTDTITGS